MGYAGFSGKNFSSRLFPLSEAKRRAGRWSRPRGKRRIVHAASLNRFLLFCKKLSSGPFLFGASIQSQLTLVLLAARWLEIRSGR
jgi:hypothetical protein